MLRLLEWWSERMLGVAFWALVLGAVLELCKILLLAGGQ